VYGILMRKSSEMRVVRFVDILTMVEYITSMSAIVQDRDTQKKIIGEHLKAADRFIKSSEFPKALDEVTKALAVEPNNMYALAYNERIKVAMEAARKKEEEEHLKKIADGQKKSAAAIPPKPPETAPRVPNMPDAKPLPANPPPVAPAPQMAIPPDDLIAKIRKDAEEAAEAKAQERVEQLKQEFTTAQLQLQKDLIQIASQVKEAEEARAVIERQLAEQLKQSDSLRSEGPAREKALIQIASQVKEAEEARAVIERQLAEQLKQSDSLRSEASAREKALIQLTSQAKEAEETRAVIERQLAEHLKQSDSFRSEAAAREADRSRQLIKTLFEKAWKDGAISDEERTLLKAAGDSIGLSDSEFASLEQSTRSSSYIAAMHEVWKDGIVTPEEAEYLENLRQTLNVSAEEHLKLESQLRRESHTKK
jgi:hypothetical protein